jgi:hypothetical protein
MVNSVQQQQAMSDAQDAAYEENLRASNQAKMDADRQINLQQAQEEESAAQTMINNDLQTRVLGSRAQVAAAESGGMLNNNAVIQDVVRQGLVANNMTSQNLDRTVSQLREQRLGARSTAQSRINSVSKGTGVNYLGAGLQGAQAGMMFQGMGNPFAKGASKSAGLSQGAGGSMAGANAKLKNSWTPKSRGAPNITW